MATIEDLRNNLKRFLDRFYLRKQSDDYNVSGVVVTDANKNITTQQSLSANSSLISGLSNVATSGSYSDLTNKPSKLTDFNNDLITHNTQSIPDGADLNEYTTVGWYYSKDNTNARSLSHTVWQETPSENESERKGYAFSLEVVRASTNYKIQILYPPSNEVYVRRGNGDTWASWNKLYTDGNLTKEVITDLGISSSDHTHTTSNISDNNTYNNIGNSNDTQENINNSVDNNLRTLKNDINNITGSLHIDTSLMNDSSLIKEMYVDGNNLVYPTLSYNDGVFTYAKSSGSNADYYHKIPLDSIPQNFEISFKGKVNGSGTRDFGIALANPTDDSYETFYIRPVHSTRVIRYTHISSQGGSHLPPSHSLSNNIETYSDYYYTVRFLKIGDYCVFRVFDGTGKEIDSINVTLSDITIEEIGIFMGWNAYVINVKDIEVYNYDVGEYVRRDDVIDNLVSTDTNRPLSANQGKALDDTKLDNNYNNSITGNVNKILVTDSSNDVKTSSTLDSSLVTYNQTGLNTIINELYDSDNFTKVDEIISNGVTVKVYANDTYVYLKYSGTGSDITAKSNTELGTLSDLTYAPYGYEYAPINQGGGVIFCYGAINNDGRIYVINTASSTSPTVYGGIMYPLKSKLPSP